MSRNVDVKNLKVEFLGFLDGNHSFEAKSARELIVVNISDVSGVISKYSHTILAGVFLSSGSLKVLASEMLRKMQVTVLNIGVDGESIGMAKTLPTGAPDIHFALIFLLHCPPPPAVARTMSISSSTSVSVFQRFAKLWHLSWMEAGRTAVKGAVRAHSMRWAE